MKKIVLLCSAGMSTSMLVKKMREAAEDEAFECEINAYSLSDAEKEGSSADIVMLGPQVRFQEKKIQTLLPDKKVTSIDMTDYGTMNGKKVLETAIKLMEE